MVGLVHQTKHFSSSLKLCPTDSFLKVVLSPSLIHSIIHTHLSTQKLSLYLFVFASPPPAGVVVIFSLSIYSMFNIEDLFFESYIAFDKCD